MNTFLKPKWPALAMWLAAGLACQGVAAQGQDDLAAKGAYIARAADCAACHTEPGGKAYAGGYAIASPLGTIYATNITPSKTAGIGGWSEAQFARAVREGVSADGHRLYPAMPYTDYAGISDSDIHALYTYLNQQVAPVDTPPAHVTQLGFPYGIRASMAFWDLLYLKKPSHAEVDPQDSLARGRYLVDVLGHCSSCHTPRNLLMATDSKRYLAGGDVAGWHAPNITSDPNAGIGGWSEDELAGFLKTGHAAGKAQAAGGMAEAVEHSLRYLSDSDLHAMAAYLKSVPAQADPAVSQPDYSYGQPPAKTYDLDNAQSRTSLDAASASTPIGAALLASRTYTDLPKVTEGARLFADACASCHQPSGAGTEDHYYPSLYHNSTTGAATPNNLVMAILHGVDRKGADGPTYMPAFAQDMNDEQVAAVASYVASRFGNPQLKVDAGTVRELRAGGPPPALKAMMPWLLALGGIVVLIVLGLIIHLLRRKPRR
ncbi:c-type cytochrome [Frateuria aurantia]